MSKIEELHTNIEALAANVDNTLLGYTHIKNTVKDCQENLVNQIERLQTRLNGNSTESQTMYDKIYNDGVVDGRQTEYDSMWDAIQDYGKRTTYLGAFANVNYKKDQFKPKYDIKLDNADYTFYYFNNNSPIDQQPDLREVFSSRGLVLDFLNSARFGSTFQFAYVRAIGTVDMSNATYSSHTFYNCQAETIEKLILPSNTKVLNGNEFTWCRKLKNIEVEGVLDTFSSKIFVLNYSEYLSKFSIISFVNALRSETTGKTLALNINAVNTAFETSPGLKDGDTSQEWLDLIATKPNWTISLGTY